MTDCIFCKIVAGDVPCHKVWEDDAHLAFLSIFPNTDGFTVVIPKKHYSSYIFAQADEVVTNLTLATKKVAQKIDRAFDDVGRSGMFYEGFGVDHLHSKLFPMHGTANMDEWKPIESKRTDFFTQYPGYLSSHDAERADDEKLKVIAQKIRDA